MALNRIGGITKLEAFSLLKQQGLLSKERILILEDPLVCDIFYNEGQNFIRSKHLD